MSDNDIGRILDRHLRTLGERESWRVRELPSEITEGVLRALDERRWIEFRLWVRDDPNPRPFTNPDPSRFVAMPLTYCGWFSPRWQPHTAGNLSAVLGNKADDAELSTELRVSNSGKTRLAELDLLDASVAKGSGGGKRRGDGAEHHPGGGRKPKAPGREQLTDRETKAYALHLKKLSHREIGKQLGISHQAAGELVRKAKAIMDKNAKWSRSVKAGPLPTDRRGQRIVPDK